MNNHLIVVGVDGSASGRRALRWAAREAAGRDTAVHAVMAWHWDGVEAEMLTATSPAEERLQATQALEHEVKAVITELGSHLPITARTIEGSAADVLTAAARGADLLVLGSHGHGRMRRTVLGSVSEACIRKATCPVVVIPAAIPKPDTDRDPAMPAASTPQ